MNKTLLLLSFILGFMTVCNGQTLTTEIKPTGIFREIDIDKQNIAIKNLQSNDEKQRMEAVESILGIPYDYNPTVLYLLSKELYQQGNKDEATFWFYVAQLRARYDANLCMDKSAAHVILEFYYNYGQDINKYAFQDIDKLEQTVTKAVDFVRNNNEDYDHRWINLYGLWATNPGLSKDNGTRELSRPQDQWYTIKNETVDSFYNSFIEYIRKQKK
jgi:hypothetical protein